MISTFFSVKQLPFFMFICASALLFIGCETDDTDYSNDQNQPHAVNKIMPLGASRVQGLSPIFESYRYELWKDLVDGGWSFDFIGTEVEIGFYSDYQGIPFDTDHQGKGGWTSGQILEDLAASLEKAGVPDIVLFSSPGGNDLHERELELVNLVLRYRDLQLPVVPHYSYKPAVHRPESSVRLRKSGLHLDNVLALLMPNVFHSSLANNFPDPGHLPLGLRELPSILRLR